MPLTRYFKHGEGDVMHFFDYIAFGVLIASVLAAGAMVLSQRKS
jgi:hypothetical protein